MTKALPFSARFIEALQLRNAEVLNKDTSAAITAAQRCATAIDELFKQPAFRELSGKLIKSVRQAHAEENKLNYVSNKVLIKLVSTMYAMSVGQQSQLDNYTRIIGANLCKLSDMTNKSNYVSLSKSVNYDELDRVQALSTRASGRGYTVGTASSQAGQVRQLLRLLGIAESVKGKRDDTMLLRENARAEQFAKLYGRTLAEVDTTAEHDTAAEVESSAVEAEAEQQAAELVDEVVAAAEQ